MAIKLNEKGFRHAQSLIKEGEFECCKGLEGEYKELHARKCKSLWKEHQATQDEINKFLITHDLKEYGQWFLGINTDIPENNKDRFVFPYGDLKIVHQDGIEYIEDEARRAGHEEIADAARQLYDMINDTEH